MNIQILGQRQLVARIKNGFPVRGHLISTGNPDKGEGKEDRVVPEVLFTVEHSPPTQVPRQPVFQSAVIGIHVLDMEGVEEYPVSIRGIDRKVQKSISAGKRSQNRRSIGAQQSLKV